MTNSMNEADNQDELLNQLNQLRLNSNPIQPRDNSPSIQSILRTSAANTNSNSLSGPPSSKRSRMISFSDPISSTGSENLHHQNQSPARNQSRILRQTPFRRSDNKRDENFDSFKIRKRRASDGDDQDEELDGIDDEEKEELNRKEQVISIPSSPTPFKRTNKRVRIKSPAPIKVNHLNRRVRSRGVRLGGIRRNSLSSVRSLTFSNDFIRSTSSTSVPSNSIPIIKRSRSRTTSSNSRSFLFRSAASLKHPNNSNFNFRFGQEGVGNQKEIERLMGGLSMKTDEDDEEKED